MLLVVVGALVVASFGEACTPSVTTVSGTHAPSVVCSGQLIFTDDFNSLDVEKWQHENTLAGGGVSMLLCTPYILSRTSTVSKLTFFR